jgi:hypothetical protein
MKRFTITQKWLEAVTASNKRRAADLEGIALTADKLRGFHVPAEKLLEYRHLTNVKMIPAKEAGKMLGLII